MNSEEKQQLYWTLQMNVFMNHIRKCPTWCLFGKTPRSTGLWPPLTFPPECWRLKTDLELWKTNLEPWKTMKTALEPWKQTCNHDKTILEPWKTMKNILEPWKTMKNQPGTMKTQPGTMKNHENRPGSRSRSWFETSGQSDHFSWQTDRQNLPIIYRLWPWPSWP